MSQPVLFLSRFLAIVTFVGLIGAAAPHVSAAAASITVDATTGHILARQDAEKKRQVGSLTKIATAMVVLDWASKQAGDLAQVATVPPAAFAGTTTNNLNLQPGDTLTLRDLLYAALVQSDNIAAYTLADYVGRVLPTSLGENPARAMPVDIFVQQMNALANHLGMKRTRFLNPSGIDTHEKPYSTAADIARLTIYAMNSAGFRFYVSQKEREIAIGRGPQRLRYLLRNTNQLLGTDSIDGVKTGSTERAGDCLVLSAARPSEVAQQGTTTLVTPRRLIVVELASPDRFAEGLQLLSTGWQLYDQWAAAGRPEDSRNSLSSPDVR